MRSRLSTWLIAAIILALVVPFAPGIIRDVYAGEESALNRAQKKTYIKTEDTQVFFTDSPVDAFTQTTVNCPGAAATTCTVRVEVSSQFGETNANHPDDRARILVTVDGSGTGVFPSDSVTVEPGPVGFSAFSGGCCPLAVRALTFAWMKTGLGVGNHVVRVQFLTGGPGFQAFAAFRTLTIQVFKP